ncbi:MAG: RNA polymerase sigma factor [candidate division Zixibacteria bacterium]|nr:RNA polymerase sigma factor [candidate division Zixibacteria bacterium]
MAKLHIESLFQSALKREKSAEDELFKALTARFQVIAQKRVWDGQDAQEIAQDALMTVFSKYREATPPMGYTPWAYKVLSNKILHYYRTTARRGEKMLVTDKIELFSASWTPDPVLEPQLKECIKKIIKANPRYARILINHFHGFKPNEICNKMTITTANFYSILSRARSLLKLCLDKGDI